MIKYFFILCFLLGSTQALALAGNEATPKEVFPPLTEADMITIYMSLLLSIPIPLFYWGKIYFKISKAIKSLPVIELSSKEPINIEALSETEKKEIFSKRTPPETDVEKALAQADRTKFIRRLVSSSTITAIICGICYFIICALSNSFCIDSFLMPIFVNPSDFELSDIIFNVACFIAGCIVVLLSFCAGMFISLLPINENLYLLRANPYFPYQKLLKERKRGSLKELYLYYKRR